MPVNPTASRVGLNGNFTTGAGANFSPHHAIEGDFMWSGLSPLNSLIRPINAPTGNAYLITLTGNYRWHADDIRGSRYGVYVLGGGGWYYRRFTVNKDFIVPPFTVCQPIYFWWGYACNAGFVDSRTIAARGSSAGGINAGAGFTVDIGDGWRFFTESRYHYAWSQFIPTTLVTVTFGFRFN